jgi:hypothetical protein
MAKIALLESDSLSHPAAPVYEISFFSQRLISSLNINAFDFHYYGNFEELRNLIHLPNFGTAGKVTGPFDAYSRESDYEDDSRSQEDATTNNSILANYLQQGIPIQSVLDNSVVEMDSVVPFQLEEVQTDGVVPDNDMLLDEP